MDNGVLIAHLFRTEYRKVVSVLCKHFGLARMELAEDIASETFLKASETWRWRGVPANPVAWLYHVAKNDARNRLQRDAVFRRKVTPELMGHPSGAPDDDIDLSPQNITDSQLQMMFAICHPGISPEAQVGLSLRILCGFGIEEIADAFLSNRETINKRLFRARERLREVSITIAFPPPAEIDERLDTVLTTIYLLFNEGYYSASQNETLRKDLCLEAMRLCHMLVENQRTNKPAVHALLSLMYFHASRFEARFDSDGAPILYEDQDTSLWNPELISRGEYFLQTSAAGPVISKYHLLAAIGYWNTRAHDTPEKWNQILQTYDRLLLTDYSPLAALNRAFALARVRGKEEGIGAVEELALTDNRFYWALLGDLYTGIDDTRAFDYLSRALAMARTPAENAVLQRKLSRLPKAQSED